MSELWKLFGYTSIIEESLSKKRGSHLTAIYIDCAAGVKGGALLGALLNTGVNPELLIRDLKGSITDPFELSFYRSVVGGVSAAGLSLDTAAAGTEVAAAAYLEERLINFGGDVGIALRGVFQKYLSATSKITGVPPEDLKLREGELLRFFILAAAFFFSLAQIPNCRVVSSPLGLLPSGTPAPEMTPLLLELARGIKIKTCADLSTCNSPLGVALLAAGTDRFGPLPEMTVESIGYGILAGEGPAGKTLRIIRGMPEHSESDAWGVAESVMVVETSIDDMNPEYFPYLIERLLEGGALDAFTSPIYMKKGRPANLLTVLCRKEKLEDALLIVFKESTTLGVRIREEKRRVLRRSFFKVVTPYGEISVKAGYPAGEGQPLQVAPEFEECKKTASEKGVPLKTVYAEAMRAALEKISGSK